MNIKLFLRLVDYKIYWEIEQMTTTQNEMYHCRGHSKLVTNDQQAIIKSHKFVHFDFNN